MFTRQLQDHVAAQREACDSDMREAIDGDQFVNYRPRIAGKSAVVKLRRKMLGVAAIAKVNPDDIRAGAEIFGGRDQHVTRGARSFHAVPKRQRRMLHSMRFPPPPTRHLPPTPHSLPPSFLS